MKEFSIEEKARRYDEAIKKINDYYEGKTKLYSDVDKTLDYLFPALKESEDEKMKREILELVSIAGNGNQFEEIKAWLEKQGEQKSNYCNPEVDLSNCSEEYRKAYYDYNKCNRDWHRQSKQKETLCDRCRKEQPSHSCQDITALGRCALEFKGEQNHADEVKPRFHKGDYIVFNGLILYITEVVKGYYRTISNIDTTNSYDWNIDNIARLWTVQDAKEGDPLVASDGSIFLFAGVVDCACKYYAALTSDNTVQINKEVEGGYWETSRSVYPATKEQCDILMKAIDDAGYAFNLELKKIVKKPSDKVKPKFKIGDWIVSTILGNARIIGVNDSKYQLEYIDGKQKFLSIDYIDKNFHPWTLQDAKDGDVLCCKSGWTCIFKSLVNDETFSSYCFMDKTKRFYEIGSERHTFKDELVKSYNGEIYPATKEQRELFFQKMKEVGYEWDSEQNQLKKTEQKPVCTPQFDVDDFIVNDCCMGKVVELTNDAYLLDNGQSIPFSCHSTHLWTIKDANDGDILHSVGLHSDCVFIFNGLDNWKFDEPDGERAVATGYCCLFASSNKMEFGVQGPNCIEVNTIKPASKIQRNLLFQKMKESGYRWDAEKKELKKVEQEYHYKGVREPKEATGVLKQLIDEQKSAWSEEDETGLADALQTAEARRCLVFSQALRHNL